MNVPFAITQVTFVDFSRHRVQLATTYHFYFPLVAVFTPICLYIYFINALSNSGTIFIHS